MDKAKTIQWLVHNSPAWFYDGLVGMRQLSGKAGARFRAYKSEALPEDAMRRYHASRMSGPRDRICHAPDNSLFFAMDGRIQSCCYNRDSPLGRYPEDSLQAVWEGKARAALSERIRRCDLSGGCQLCASQLQKGGGHHVPAGQYDAGAKKAPHWPTRMDFELSNACNLECRMCSGAFSSAIRKNREKRPPLASPYGESFFKELEPFLPHLRIANFLGGEPFLIPAYKRIWKRLAEVNPTCQVRIQTNGSIWNERIVGELEPLDVHLAVSMDAAQAAPFEAIRCGAQFDSVLRNLEQMVAFTKSKGTFLIISSCAMSINMDQMHPLLSMANGLGAVWQLNTVLQPLHLALWTQSSRDLRALRETLSKPLPAAASVLAKRNNGVFGGFLAALEGWEKEAGLREQRFRAWEAEAPDVLERKFRNETFGGLLDSIALASVLRNAVEPLLRKGDQQQNRAVLMRLFSLPFDWLQQDPLLLEDPLRFGDKAGVYLEHGVEAIAV